MTTYFHISGTLRDDIIFFIYLYQRYIYRIDPTRVNEFGFSGDMLDNKGEVKVGEGEESSQKAITDGSDGASQSTSSDASKQTKSQREGGKTRSKSKKEKKFQ